MNAKNGKNVPEGYLSSSSTYFISVPCHVSMLPLTYTCLKIVVIRYKDQANVWQYRNQQYVKDNCLFPFYEVLIWFINICLSRGRTCFNFNYIFSHSKAHFFSLSDSFDLIYLTGWFGNQPPCRPHTEQLLPLAVNSGRQRGPTPWPCHSSHRTRHLLLEEWTLWHSRYVFIATEE